MLRLLVFNTTFNNILNYIVVAAIDFAGGGNTGSRSLFD
jgi:hypothetical protein